MATTAYDKKSQLKEMATQFAPIVAQWMRAFLECSEASQAVVREMIGIINDPDADQDDKEMAAATLVEALFPSSHDGKPGVDLDELESLESEESPAVTAIVHEMDREEENFGQRVLTLMKSQGMTQETLAEKIGVQQSAISMLVNRGARPQKRTVERIAKALGVEPSDLWPMSH